MGKTGARPPARRLLGVVWLRPHGRGRRHRAPRAGDLAGWFEARGLTAHVSVTDEGDYASSIVVVERAA